MPESIIPENCTGYVGIIVERRHLYQGCFLTDATDEDDLPMMNHIERETRKKLNETYGDIEGVIRGMKDAVETQSAVAQLLGAYQAALVDSFLRGREYGIRAFGNLIRRETGHNFFIVFGEYFGKIDPKSTGLPGLRTRMEVMIARNAEAARAEFVARPEVIKIQNILISTLQDGQNRRRVVIPPRKSRGRGPR